MDNYGLLGQKLGHSLSPTIHKMIFDYVGIEGEYSLYPTQIDDIHKLIDKINHEEIRGINVTIPYKLEVMKYLDKVSDEAEYINAVNTVCTKNGKLTGYNTDCFGFEKTLLINNINPKNKNVAVLGTGGASKAVVYVFNKLHAATIDLFSRNPQDGQKGYDRLKVNHNYDIIVNTTPVGMHPNVDKSPIGKDAIGKSEAVVDIVYNPIETKLLSYARELGKIHVNGMYMLVAQAVKAQEIFNSIEIPNNIIRKIYESIIGDKENG